MPSITLPGIGHIEYAISSDTREPALVVASLPPEVQALARAADQADAYEHQEQRLGVPRAKVLSRFTDGTPSRTRYAQQVRSKTVARAGGDNGLLESSEHERSLPSRLLFWRQAERDARAQLNAIQDGVARAVADRREARSLLEGDVGPTPTVALQHAQRRLRSAMSSLQSERDRALHTRLGEILTSLPAAGSLSEVTACLQSAIGAIDAELAPSYSAAPRVVSDEVHTDRWTHDEFLD